MNLLIDLWYMMMSKWSLFHPYIETEARISIENQLDITMCVLGSSWPGCV